MDLQQRKIAIFTDAHALYEPTKAILDDVKSRGITEIYSLGDNIGVGPNPSEVINLLDEYNVISIAGNSEDYTTLGIEPFKSYFNDLKTKSQLWTLSKLDERQKKKISLFPHSIELLVGGKKLALCHFANDVRFDYSSHSTWTYQDNIRLGKEAYKQFLYTNSIEQLNMIKEMVQKYGYDSPMMKGYLSAINEPLFNKNRVYFYDAIIQGHVHWKIYEKGDSTEFYSIRAVAMGYDEDPIDRASYVILNELDSGFEIEDVLVLYDREKMEHSIMNTDNPNVLLKKYVNFGKNR